MSLVALFDSEDLLPAAWDGLRRGPLWAFNPGLLALADGWLLAYRIVGGDGLRRIGLCRLTPDFAVIAGTPTAFSDAIVYAPGQNWPRWFADPRLVRLGGRVFLHWNSGWQAPRNAQFLQEIDLDTLAPRTPPRELCLIGPRRAIEKNWMLFGDGPFFAVYSVCPHRILTFALDGTGDIPCLEVDRTAWDDGYAPCFGEIRGGAPPVPGPDGLVSFCHSVDGVPGQYVYRATAYRFAADFPFRPTHGPIAPLTLMPDPGPAPRLPRLNPKIHRVIYPTGASYVDGRWIVSFGIDDERCAIAAVTADAVAAILKPVTV